MTTLTSSTISILRPHRALVPVFLTAVLLNVLAAAPPAATSPPAAGENKQSEPKDKAQALIDNFDRVRFTNESASHYYYSRPDSPEPPVSFFPAGGAATRGGISPARAPGDPHTRAAGTGGLCGRVVLSFARYAADRGRPSQGVAGANPGLPHRKGRAAERAAVANCRTQGRRSGRTGAATRRFRPGAGAQNRGA